MPIAVNNKNITAINCEGREIVRAHAGLSLVFSKQQDLYGGMDISSIADLVMFRDLINTGTCIWNGVSTNTYKGNTIATGGLGATWYVTADIDMSAVCSPILGSWVPIGTSSRRFRGAIDGLNNSISNMYINTTLNDQGLFAYVDAATIINISLLNVNITAGQYSAGIAAWLYKSTTISNCIVSGNIAGSYYVAGIAAYITGNALTISHCVNNAQITAFSNCAGIYAVVSGAITSNILYNRNNGNISGLSYVGGIAVSVSLSSSATMEGNESRATVTANTTLTFNVYCGALFANISTNANYVNNTYDNTIEIINKACGAPRKTGSYDVAGKAYGTTLP